MKWPLFSLRKPLHLPITLAFAFLITEPESKQELRQRDLNEKSDLGITCSQYRASPVCCLQAPDDLEKQYMKEVGRDSAGFLT